MCRKIETIIIGGGIAGLACARRLHDQGREFRLLTDRLGGRMHSLEKALHNFGAIYITSDYRYVRRYVRKGERVRMHRVAFWDNDRFITILNPRNCRRAKAIARLYRELLNFRRHFNQLRTRSPWVCQAKLLQSDPWLERTVREPATEFVRRHDFNEIDQIFTNSILRSTVFAETDQVNTFYYLACLMPILLPTYIADFSKTIGKLTAGFSHHISLTKVLSLKQKRDGLYEVTTDREQLKCRHVVVATPCHNTRTFCPELDCTDDDRVCEIPISTLHVSGRRRSEFQPGKTAFLPPEHPVTVLMPIGNGGPEILFGHKSDPDLTPFFDEYRITDCVSWKTGIILSGPKWRPLSPRMNLYTIGDYNICGLEDSFLTGLFAANQILVA